MVKIIPAVLTASPDELRRLIAQAEEVSDRIQIDIVDGQFAANKTIDPSILEEIDTNLKIDFHLMTKEPIDWIERCVRGMADRIIGQIEMMKSQIEFVGKVQGVGASAGLAVNIDTPIEKLDPSILNDLDVVLVMSVQAGFAGQEFDRRALDKIKRLDGIRERDDTAFKICDDGGITFDNIRKAEIRGVDEVIIGKRLFEGDIKANIENFMKKAYK